MIKGLYFKLNMNNDHDKYIHDFFERAKSRGLNKVNVLYNLCRMFPEDSILKLTHTSELGADAIKEKMEESKI